MPWWAWALAGAVTWEALSTAVAVYTARLREAQRRARRRDDFAMREIRDLRRSGPR